MQVLSLTQASFDAAVTQSACMAIDPAQITALLRRICALDMAKIKAEIEEQKQAERALQMRRECPTTRLISESHRKAG